MSDRICIVNGCDAPYHCKQMCRLHYERMRKFGSTDLPIPEPRACSVTGCETPVGTRKDCLGYCKLHYDRWRKWGTTDLPPRGRDSECSVGGCGRLVGDKGARGLCPLHFGRLHRVGSVDLPDHGWMKDRICAVDGCDRAARNMDRCPSHYGRRRKYGDDELAFKWSDNRECVVCGVKDWPPNGLRVTCSVTCFALKQTYGDKLERSRPCARCGEEIDLMGVGGPGKQKRSASTLMCKTCAAARHLRHKMSVNVLAKRDGTDCSICHEPIDMTLRKPSLFGPSVDHVMPWARGGTHDPENLALAHLWCNQVKQAQLNFTF